MFPVTSTRRSASRNAQQTQQRALMSLRWRPRPMFPHLSLSDSPIRSVVGPSIPPPDPLNHRITRPYAVRNTVTHDYIHVVWVPRRARGCLIKAAVLARQSHYYLPLQPTIPSQLPRHSNKPRGSLLSNVHRTLAHAAQQLPPSQRRSSPTLMGRISIRSLAPAYVDSDSICQRRGIRQSVRHQPERRTRGSRSPNTSRSPRGPTPMVVVDRVPHMHAGRPLLLTPPPNCSRSCFSLPLYGQCIPPNSDSSHTIPTSISYPHSCPPSPPP